jgi:hypothetical protein
MLADPHVLSGWLVLPVISFVDGVGWLVLPVTTYTNILHQEHNKL